MGKCKDLCDIDSVMTRLVGQSISKASGPTQGDLQGELLRGLWAPKAY